MNSFLEYFRENEDIKKQLLRMGAEVNGDKVTLYRGGDVSKEELKKLRYNDFLSTVKSGSDSEGNAGADSYGKNIITITLPIKDLKYSNGEIQYIGKSASITGNKYPIEIYKAYNDYYGSNYTYKDIDNENLRRVRNIVSGALSDGRDEFDELMMKKYGEKEYKDMLFNTDMR